MNLPLRKFRTLVTLMIIVVAVLYLPNCTSDNQIIGPGITLGKDLLSKKISTSPTIDGVIDPSWDSATKLNLAPAVPDPGNGLFAGYIGDVYNGTMRSMYDNDYVYFLVEIADNTKNIKSSPWYFNPITKKWARESTSRSYDVNGKLSREGWGEDKFSFLWNIDNSTPKFSAQTCFASCHIFEPYTDFSVTPPVQRSNANSGNHYTNGTNEKIDMWWGHPNRGFVFGNMDDNYQDWAGGPAVMNLVGGNGNGRHFDDLVVSGVSATWPNRPSYTSDATQGSTTNTQKLKIEGTETEVDVPLWVIPNATNLDFIKGSDTQSGGTAVKITSVNAEGVLTYAGGTIDPNVGTDYQRIGDKVYGGIGSKSIPGVIVTPVINGRADITLSAVHTGTGWIYEFKRLIKTSDNLKQDIDFSSLDDQPFGFAYWNGNNNQHAIKPNLKLIFER